MKRILPLLFIPLTASIVAFGILSTTSCSKAANIWIKCSSPNFVLEHTGGVTFTLMSNKEIKSDVKWEFDELSTAFKMNNSEQKEIAAEYTGKHNTILRLEPNSKLLTSTVAAKTFPINATYNGKKYTSSIEYKPLPADVDDKVLDFDKDEIIDINGEDILDRFGVPEFTNDNLDPDGGADYWGDEVKTRYGLLMKMYETYSSEQITSIVAEAISADYLTMLKNMLLNETFFGEPQAHFSAEYWYKDVTTQTGVIIPLISYEIKVSFNGIIIDDDEDQIPVNQTMNFHAINMCLSSIGIDNTYSDDIWGNDTLSEYSCMNIGISSYYKDNDVSKRFSKDNVSGLWESWSDGQNNVPVWDGKIEGESSFRNVSPAELSSDTNNLPSFLSNIDNFIPKKNAVSVQQNTVLSATSVYANPNSIYNTPENTKKYLMPNIWAWDGRWEYTFGVDHYDVNPDYENIDRDIYLNVATRFEGDLFNYRGPSNNIRTYINVYDIDRTTPMKNIFGGTKPWLAISGVTYRELYDRYNMRWNLTYYLNDNYLIFNRANNNDWGREISDVSIIYS